mmetsp:Transcript_15119/g.19937  ORF Transcript_15119/g.19937 Transcript_15119/m.19937 type:complete len:232 (-) Transcript_15119:627-1322(-)
MEEKPPSSRINFKITHKKRKQGCNKKPPTSVFKTIESDEEFYEDDATMNFHHSTVPLTLEDVESKSLRLKNEGNLLAEAGKFAQALQRWEDALQLTPQNHLLHELKAQVFMEMGRDFEAVKSATEAVKLSPAWSDGHLTLGHAQINFGELELAITSFKRARCLNSKLVDIDEEIAHAESLVKKRSKILNGSSKEEFLKEGGDEEKDPYHENEKEVNRCFKNLSRRAKVLTC